LSTYVKICGNTSSADISAAISGGANAVGFLVGLSYPSEDEISPSQARLLATQLPPFIAAVVVTHHCTLPEITSLCTTIPASHLQLHGDFPADKIPTLRTHFPHLKIIKAVHVLDVASIKVAVNLTKWVDAILLDSKTPTRIGGTGQTHDWTLSREIRDAVFPLPVILAGGLNPQNVKQAINTVRPFAVDVNSGVSVRRGLKSNELVTAFVSNARSI